MSESFVSEKYFVAVNTLFSDSFELANKIYENYKPTFVVALWRGGCPIGMSIQEFFAKKGVKTNHISIRTSGYDGEVAKPEVKVYGTNYLFEKLGPEDRLLIVDDIFDSGRSAAAVFNIIRSSLGDRYPREMKLAVLFYKPENNKTNITPNFYIHTTDKWVVFPHELIGLSDEEIKYHKPSAAKWL